LSGTLAYTAPEAQKKNYGKEIDIFSFGHLALFIGMQQTSFHLLAPTFTDLCTHLLQPCDEVQQRQDHFSYVFKKLEESQSLVTMMKECLANNPES